MDQVREIAQAKMADINANDIDHGNENNYGNRAQYGD